MPYELEGKLVVGVSSTALFDLSMEDDIFETQGVEAYKRYQELNRHVPLAKGVAFPFIRRFLNLNTIFPDQLPVEVVVLSKNSPETGIRTFHSIKEYGLGICRAVFTSGSPAYKYIPAFNISLFLSTDPTDVKDAIDRSYPAGRVLSTTVVDDEADDELRIAFDFDGVLADDQSEKIYRETDELALFYKHEVDNLNVPMNPGLLMDFFRRLAYLQALESEKAKREPGYRKVLKTSIITARSAPSHERAINTLKSWRVTVDEMFFLGGIEKKRILQILRPHLFVDDQLTHLSMDLRDVPLVHIPFGVANVQPKPTPEPGGLWEEQGG